MSCKHIKVLSCSMQRRHCVTIKDKKICPRQNHTYTGTHTPFSISTHFSVVAELDAVHKQMPLRSVLKLWVGKTVWVATRTSIRC